ncbi:MAG: hypothetical protein IJ400_04845 [Clostridia bacterium]|nr:hypothetical protein [Clostridia bacterium]
MENDKIIIFYDKRHNFYIKKISGQKDFLPESFISFKHSHKRILADAYPHAERHIMSSRDADNEINEMIREYREEAKKSEVVRWYQVSTGKLKKISDGPKEAYQAAECEGRQSTEDIILRVEELRQELFHEEYLVFQCPKCQEKQLQLIKKKKVTCGNCHESHNIYDSIENAKRFDSQNSAQNKANAISYLLQLKKEEPADSAPNIKSSFPFYFKGNVYRVSYNDCRSLHHELYKEFAVQEVFTMTDKGVAFTQGYKNYLKSLNDYGVNTSIYKELSSIENKINSQEYDLLPIEKAFYWYMNEYCLGNVGELRWSLSGQIACFNSIRQFVDALLIADSSKREQLINLYMSVASIEMEKAFFGDYENSSIGLSFMIYEKTGLFVYVTDDRQLINFGTSFIEDLHRFDDLISNRNIFIESIKRYSRFWDKVKGSLDDINDYYFDSIDGTYYDRLCFYQYAIQGKKEIRYKDIVLSDSVQGFKQMKSIICDAYMSKLDECIKRYKQLVELLKNHVLWDDDNRFVKIREAHTSNEAKTVLTFASLKDLIVNETGNEPSVSLYLKCLDVSSKSINRIKFWHKGRFATLLEQTKALVESVNSEPIAREVSRFYNNSDVACVIEYILDNTKEGGASKFKSEQEKAFNVLASKVKELNKELETQRKKLADDEARGVRRKNEVPISKMPSDKSSLDKKPIDKKPTDEKPIKVEKRRNDGDEWS